MLTQLASPQPLSEQDELDKELDDLMEEDLEEQMLRVNAPGQPVADQADELDELPSVPQEEIEEQRQLEELEAVWN